MGMKRKLKLEAQTECKSLSPVALWVSSVFSDGRDLAAAVTCLSDGRDAD